MKQNNTLLSLLIFLGTFIYSHGQETSNFYLADNGVTCMCPDAAIGDTGTLTIDGVDKTFTKRNRAGLDALIAADENDDQIALTCTSGIDNMSGMFRDTSVFNQDISSWDVSSVTSMSIMFFRASTFNGDISLWDVSSVTSLGYMFVSASAFNQDLSSWNVSNVTSMDAMFAGASVFNQDLSSWVVSNVTNMGAMFSGASAFNQDLSKWNVSKVNDMHWMFRNAKAFNQNLSKWDVSNVTDMHGMFEAALAFNQDLSSWDVSKVMDMRTMFKEAAAFNQDLSNWCVALIDSKPIEFDLSSALTGTNLPKWGEACTTLNTNDFSSQTSIKLYPNPASSYISFEASGVNIKAIHIYDMMGRLVLTSQKLSFSLHNLPRRMYLAKVFNDVDQTSNVLKFIKD